MKKTLLIFTIFLCAAALLGLPGTGMAKSDTLVIAVDSPPRTMDPHGADADANLSIMANFFDGLLQRTGPDGTLAPALAERWEHPDPLTWKFYLRKGVKFVNGNAFTSADVKFSFERLSNPQISEFVNEGKSIATIETPDDYTVIIKTKTNIPWFLNNLHQIFIMDKESTENRDPGDVGIRPIGTGAYKLTEWVKGSYLKMEANEHYWGGAPAVKKVELRPITEASTRFAALVSGQANIVSGVPVEMYDNVVKNSKIQVVTRPSRRSIFLAIGNKSGSPTADIRVRTAMYMAIDENEIIEKIMRGHASPAAQVPDPPTIGYNADIKRLPYDPVTAKKLLKEAGYANGFDITLTGPNDRYINDANIAEAVAKYLAKIGIRVKLDVKPKSIFFPQVNSGSLDFYLIGWFDGTFDMGRTYSVLAHTRGEGYGGLNGAAYSDKDIDRLLESTFKMVDAAQRKQALEKLNKMAMVDKIVWIPLHYQQDIYAVQKSNDVVFTPRPDGWMVCKEITKK
jgi:peptide/nickel transport system substrate-binding protein